ncbi:unnamed protein product [Boreogadus saida]
MDERVLYCVVSDGIVFRDSAQVNKSDCSERSRAVSHEPGTAMAGSSPIQLVLHSGDREREREDICHSAGWMNVGHSSPAAIKDPQPHGAVSQLRRRSPPGTGDLKQGTTAEILPVMSLAQRRRRPAPPQYQR